MTTSRYEKVMVGWLWVALGEAEDDIGAAVDDVIEAQTQRDPDEERAPVHVIDEEQGLPVKRMMKAYWMPEVMSPMLPLRPAISAM